MSGKDGRNAAGRWTLGARNLLWVLQGHRTWGKGMVGEKLSGFGVLCKTLFPDSWEEHVSQSLASSLEGSTQAFHLPLLGQP